MRCSTCGKAWRNPNDPIQPFRHAPGHIDRHRRGRRAHWPLLRARAPRARCRSRVESRSRLRAAGRVRAPDRRIPRGRSPAIRAAARAAGLRVPAARVDRDSAHSVRRNPHLRRACRPRGRSGSRARRRCRDRAQSPVDHRAVPSRRRQRRQPNGLRGRNREKDAPSRAGRSAPAGGAPGTGGRGLRPADLARLVALAAMWGGSYLFMRAAVPYLGAVPLIALRVLIAGVALFAFLVATGGRIDWRRHWRGFLFVGAVGLAAPFVLIAEALTVIDASTAAILNALSPLFASLVAAAWIRDPVTPAKITGIALCLA